MRERCESRTSKDYKDYGAKGIAVCRRWASFAKFIEDMGERPSRHHTLDRIKTTRGYTPKNCRWVTRDVQANNRTDSVRASLGGVTRTIAEWARHLGVPVGTLWYRIRRMGWSARRALTTPIRSYGRVVS